MRTCSQCGAPLPEGQSDRCPNCRARSAAGPPRLEPVSEWQYVATSLRRNRKAILFVAAIVLLATAGGIGWLLFQDRAASRARQVAFRTAQTARDHRILRESIRLVEAGTNGTGRRSIAITEVLPMALAESSVTTPLGTNIPPRDPQTSANLIDLSPWYNAVFTQGWFPPFTPERLANNAFQGLDPGPQWMGNVPFDVRGVIQLDSVRMQSHPYPEEVRGVRIGRRCRRLHFLHGTAWNFLPGAEIGRYVLHAGDGTTQTIPIRYGVALRDWQLVGDRNRTATAAEVAWIGGNSNSPLRLFKFSWDNPRPDVPIQTLDFVSTRTTCAPFLLAITTEGPDDDVALMALAGALVNPFLLVQRAAAFERANRLEAALADYSKAIEVAEANPEKHAGSWQQALLGRSTVFQRMGRRAAAGEDYCRALGCPVRDPRTRPQLLDLSLSYNASLHGNWHGDIADNDLSQVPTGLEKLAGVEFDVRGLVQLDSGNPREPRFPVEATNIVVGLKCRRLHFLHASVWGTDTNRVPIGSYVLHFTGGQTVKFPIVLGRDVRDWWKSRTERPIPEGMVVAWEGTNAKSRQTGQTIRLFKSTWDNPLPGTELKSLDFVSKRAMAAPFLVAVTVE